MASTDPAVLIEEALERVVDAGNYLYFGTTRESKLSRQLSVVEERLRPVLNELRAWGG